MSRPQVSKFRPYAYVAICMVLTISFSSCSRGAAQQPAGAAAGTGAISFRLVWQRPPSSKIKSLFSPSFNACVDNGIDTIAATVYDAANNAVISDSWPCSAHQGVLSTVPAGSNYTVKVNGILFGLTAWNGQAGPLTVTAGQITDAGTISMIYTDGDTTNPTVTGFAPASNAVNVPVTSRMTISFSEPMAASTVNATTITLLNSSTTGTVPGLVSYDATGNIATFTSSTLLDYATQYVLGITSGVTDLANNPLVSAYTNTFTTEPAPLAAPEAPLSVSAAPGNSQVTLDWPAVNGATSYNVYYGLTSGVTTANGTKISDVRAPFIHLGLTNDQPYFYIVTAASSTFGESPASTEVNATPMADILAAGLVAYYPFNGNANDASGNAHDGTVSGATLTTDRFEYAGSAYGFDGSTSAISLGDLGAINDYSVSLWFRKGVASGYPATGEADLFGTQTSTGTLQEFKFGFAASQQDQLIISLATTSSDSAVYTTPTVTDTNWHHLVVTRSGISLEAYLDDVQQALTAIASTGAPSGTITSGNVTELGTVGGVIDAIFNGVLDDVRIYSRVLPAGEITRLFYAADPNVPSPPASLTATPGTGQNVITWPDVAGATSYNLYWSTTPIIDKTEADHVIRDVASPYTHAGLTSGQQIYYIITAMNSFGESAESMQAAATPL